MKKYQIFLAYSTKDELLKDELLKHLEPNLARRRKIKLWNASKITPGEEWNISIINKIKESDIFLFLLSPDSISSEYLNNVEVKRALKKHAKGKAIVIPIMLRPCSWQELKIAKFQILPRNGKPISRWEDQDEAFLHVAQEIDIVINQLYEKNRPSNNNTKGKSSNLNLIISYAIYIIYTPTEELDLSKKESNTINLYQKEKQSRNKNIKLFKYKSINNGKFGYKNVKGERVIPSQFESASNFSEGYAIIKKSGLFGILKEKEKKDYSVEPTLKYYSIQNFKEGLAGVYDKKNSFLGYINPNGKIQFKSKNILKNSICIEGFPFTNKKAKLINQQLDTIIINRDFKILEIKENTK